MNSPKVVIYGEVSKIMYTIDWDFMSNPQQIYNNPDQYVVEYKNHSHYERIKDTGSLKDGLYDVVKSKFDATNNRIIHYTNYPVRVECGNEDDKQIKIRMVKREAEIRIQQIKECREDHSKKWYQFWKE